MKLKNTLTIGILILLINYVTTINILGIFPYQGKSHFFQFKVFLKELASRGHNVTVISYFPEEVPSANYRDVVIGETKILEDEVPMHKSYYTILVTAMYLAHFGKENCKALVASPQVQDLMRSKPKFDVVIVEQFNSDCALGVAYKLGAPVVGMTSHVLMPYHYNRFGIPSNPAYVPFHFLEGGTKPSLYQRIERFIFDIVFKLLYKTVQWSDRNTIIDQFGDIPHLEDLAKDIKILLLYQSFMLTGSRLIPANVIEVGGYHVADAKPISGDLKKFMDEAELGVIFISFGSMIKSSTMPEQKKQAIVDAINELPQRFVWKWDDSSLKVDKNKVFISDWLPQIDILGEFRERAKAVSRAWHDRPMSPLDTAVYWTEFTARNYNITLRTPAADTPLYQHLYLDVAAVLIILLISIIYLLKTLTTLLRTKKKPQFKVESKKSKKKSKRD